MEWKLWGKSRPNVKDNLTIQFRVDSAGSGKMRLAEQPGLFSYPRVRFIQIFDSSAISHGMGDRVKYPDLHLSGDRKALLFEGNVEGHIEKDRKVLLADRRALSQDWAAGRGFCGISWTMQFLKGRDAHGLLSWKMISDMSDPRFAILKFLHLRDEYRGGPPPTLTELVTALGSPLEVTKDACNSLELEGYILSNGAFETLLASQGLSYLITDLGKWYLLQGER